MEIVWLIHPINQRETIQALNCSSAPELQSLLDTIYYGVANDLKTDLEITPKPVVKFVPSLEHTITFSPTADEKGVKWTETK